LFIELHDKTALFIGVKLDKIHADNFLIIDESNIKSNIKIKVYQETKDVTLQRRVKTNDHQRSHPYAVCKLHHKNTND